MNFQEYGHNFDNKITSNEASNAVSDYTIMVLVKIPTIWTYESLKTNFKCSNYHLPK